MGQVFSSAQPYGLNFQEIKSHSSFLSNERLHVMFANLDYASQMMNETFATMWLKRTKSLAYQVWKNIRPLVQYNPMCRAHLGLNTQVSGVYTVDVAFSDVERKMIWCELYNGYTYKTNFIISQTLNKIEVLLRSIMQYFSYFFRPEFKQKPDVIEAAVEFKRHADKLTVDQIMKIVGPNNSIDFGNLGLGADKQVEFDDNVDDVMSEEEG